MQPEATPPPVTSSAASRRPLPWILLGVALLALGVGLLLAHYNVLPSVRSMLPENLLSQTGWRRHSLASFIGAVSVGLGIVAIERAMKIRKAT